MNISGRDNNISLLRFLAATAVVLEHACVTTQRDLEDPVRQVFGTMSAGDVGVDIFFFISGLLVTKSFLGRSVPQFAWARMTRIFPGLWVSTLLLVVLAGLFFSPLGPLGFWLRYDTLNYLAHNLTMLPHFGWQDRLPFALDATHLEFNWSLWTLPLELKMYMLLLVIGVVGGLRRPLAVAALAIAGAAAQMLYRLSGLELLPHDLTRFLFFFFAGATTYLWRDRVTLSTRGLLICLAIPVAAVALGTAEVVRQAALALTLPYFVLWFAYVPQGRIRLWNRVGDFSYGIYIYACPVQIVLSHTAAGGRPLGNFALTMLIVVPIAALSWYGVESRALRMPVPPTFERVVEAMLQRFHKLRAWSPGHP